MEAWKDDCLNDEYFSKWLDEMAIELSTLEETVVPNGWACQWDKYVTCNLLKLWINKMFHNNTNKKSFYILFYNLFRRGFRLIKCFF